ncbi:MAG: hypothetical protein K8R74_06685 [Bacteroidales bacterium]|nr:hypothetical protein [Bacteroidales bacterium]
MLVFLALAIPFGFVFRDLKQTMKRFDIEMDPAKLTGSKNNSYNEAAGKIFENDADVIAFIYGHTHTPSIKQKGDRYVINTGTWLKQFERVSPRFGLLPAIYVPHYKLNYFKVKTEGGNIIIEYHKIAKSASSDLSLIQRMMVSRQKRKKMASIPSRTVINFT